MQTTPALDGICRGNVYNRDGGRDITHKGYMGITLTGCRLSAGRFRLMAATQVCSAANRSTCYHGEEFGDSRTDGSATESSHMNFDKELDARGLNCPMPILKAKKSLTDMSSGQVLKIVSTDPGSVKDMQAFCKQTGNELLSSAEDSKTYVFFVQKK